MKTKIIKYWKYFVYVFCGILLVVPFSKTFEYPLEEGPGVWTYVFAFNSLFFAALVGLPILLLVFIPRIKRIIIKRSLIVLTILLAGLFSFYASLLIMLPIQDWSNLFTILLLFVFYPVVVVDVWLSWKK